MSQEIPIVTLDHDPNPEVDYLKNETSKQQELNVQLNIEQKKPGKINRTVKTVGCIAVAGLLIAGGFKIKDIIEGLSFNSKHKAELTISAPETNVYKDVHLDLAKFNSTFAVSLDTSLDRFGPNCDTKTRHTGKKGEDKKITTETNAGLVIDNLSVTKNDDSITVTAEGDIRLGISTVDYKKNRINVEGASGGIDICVGTTESTSARNIIDVAVQGAGGVATGCALENSAGKKAFRQGLAEFVSKTDMARGVNPSTIKVEIPNYQKSAESIYGQQVKEFNHSVSSVLDKYVKQTEDHDLPILNDSDLIDCSKHQINFIG